MLIIIPSIEMKVQSPSNVWQWSCHDLLLLPLARPASRLRNRCKLLKRIYFCLPFHIFACPAKWRLLVRLLVIFLVVGYRRCPIVIRTVVFLTTGFCDLEPVMFILSNTVDQQFQFIRQKSECLFGRSSLCMKSRRRVRMCNYFLSDMGWVQNGRIEFNRVKPLVVGKLRASMLVKVCAISKLIMNKNNEIYNCSKNVI